MFKRKIIVFIVLIIVFIPGYGQTISCCNGCKGYKDYIIKNNNNVDIGFKIQKRTNNEKGNNVYSVIGYAKNNNDYAVNVLNPARFKIVGIKSVNIPGISHVLNVNLTMGLDAHSSEVVIGTIHSLQEPFVEVNGFLYGRYKKR